MSPDLARPCGASRPPLPSAPRLRTDECALWCSGIDGRCDLGPAGLAAGVYGASEGLSTVVLDAVATGGHFAAHRELPRLPGRGACGTGRHPGGEVWRAHQRAGRGGRARVARRQKCREARRRDGPHRPRCADRHGRATGGSRCPASRRWLGDLVALDDHGFILTETVQRRSVGLIDGPPWRQLRHQPAGTVGACLAPHARPTRPS
jgi:hypothetical protein